MAIKQINCTYVAVEDRVMLRVNTDQEEQYSVWLTRALCRNLLNELLSAERTMLGIENAQSMGTEALIQDFRREGELAAADFSQRFEEAHNSPLGPSPILATEIRVARDREFTTLHLGLVSNQRIHITLAPKLVHGLTKMLLDVQRKAAWNLDHGNVLTGAGTLIRH